MPLPAPPRGPRRREGGFTAAVRGTRGRWKTPVTARGVGNTGRWPVVAFTQRGPASSPPPPHPSSSSTSTSSSSSARLLLLRGTTPPPLDHAAVAPAADAPDQKRVVVTRHSRELYHVADSLIGARICWGTRQTNTVKILAMRGRALRLNTGTRPNPRLLPFLSPC